MKIKFYKLMLGDWYQIIEPTYQDTLLTWVYLYDDNGLINGIGIY